MGQLINAFGLVLLAGCVLAIVYMCVLYLEGMGVL
jgi:hypothetical protein